MKILKTKLVVYFLIFSVLAAIIIMISIEAFGGGNIRIRNKTGKEIKSFEAVVVDDDILDIGVMYEGPVAANETVKASFDKIDIGGREDAQAYFAVRFEGYDTKVEITEGCISKDFKGNTDIDIYEEDGILYMKVKMGTALFGSTKNTNVNETYVLYPDEADYDYAFDLDEE